MPNQTNPVCRDAFIAAMKAKGPSPQFTERDDDGWTWNDGIVAAAYDGFCLAYQPPRDVDPKTLLGKLKEVKASTGYCGCCIASKDPSGFTADIIATIESLQQKADSLASKGKTDGN